MRVAARGSVSIAAVAAWLGLAALGCAGGGTASGDQAKLDRVQPCQGSSDGWCKATSQQAGFGAYFPGNVAESTSAPQPTPTGERVVVHRLASQNPAGARFSLTCIEYVEGRADPKKLLADVTKVGKPEANVQRGGFEGRLIRYPQGTLQAIAGPRFLCTQNVEATNGSAVPSQGDVDRFFRSLVFGALARP